MNTAATLCVLALLSTSGQLSIHASFSGSPLIAGDDSLTPGAYWTLSSSWKWNASRAGDRADWRVEREDWNDTITIENVSGSELHLRLNLMGRGSVNASGSFMIGGRSWDSWPINRQYSFKVNATSLLDSSGRPLRWIASEKGLQESGLVPQMWTDKDYSYVEVQFRVAGSEHVTVKGIPVDAWIVSYANLTTGYWSQAGKHSVGFKEEMLSYDKRLGLLLRNTYNGSYSMRTEDGWNETETFTSIIVDSSLDFSRDSLATDRTDFIVLGIGVTIAVIAILAAITYRRRKIRLSRSASGDSLLRSG